MVAFCFTASARKFFSCRIYRLFLSVVGVCLILQVSFSQEINAYKTFSSGDFSDISTWIVWDGSFWNPAVVKPDRTNDIYIDQTHTLRLIGNEEAKSVFINAETGAGQKLNLNDFNLDIYGSLQAFVGSAPGVPAGTNASTDWIGNSMTSTITFKGVSRVIIPDGAWSAQSTNSRYTVIFDPGPGMELITQRAFKALRFTVRSGILNQKINTTSIPNACATFSFNTNPSFGPSAFGSFIIENGGVLISECNSNIIFRSASISALNFDLQNGGTLILEGETPRIESANFQLNGKVIYRGGTTAKTYLSSSYADAATPNAVRDLELQGTQDLSLPNQLTLLGNLEKSGTGNFITNATALTLAGGNDQQILGFPLVIRDLILNKTSGIFYPNADLSILRNLTLTQGSIDMQGNDLLINTGLAGSLSYTGGTWRNLGQLSYFGIPTNLDGTNSTFPFEDTRNSGIRKLQLLGTSIGGNLSINFTEYEGAEYNSGFNDLDSTPILYRLFSYFQFSGLSPSTNPVELRISADDLIVDNVDDLRIVGTGYAAPGVHLPGLDPVELWARRELTFDDLLGVNFTVGSFRTLSILPIIWLEVSCKSSSEGNRITWKVAKEENNLLFEVYRTSNPMKEEWKKVGVINSIGNTNQQREYNYLDTTAEKFKEYFYRIRQVDFSGRWTWSKVTKAAYKRENLAENQLLIFPNPYVSGDIQVILPDFIDPSNAELTLQDSQGKTIIHSLFVETNLSEIVSNLSPGLYLVRVISEGKELTGRLIRR